MRILALLPLALLTTGCLAQGERDPTRYPWDPRNHPALTPAPHPPVVARGAIPRIVYPPHGFVPPQGTYCVMAIEPQSNSGIIVGGKAPGILSCSVIPNPSRKPRI